MQKMADTLLGPFEEMVLLSLLRLDNRTYGMEIRRDLEGRVGRTVTIGAVYSALERMETKGYVSSEKTEGGGERGGRGRRYFTVLPAGARALARGRSLREAAWDGVSLEDVLGPSSS